MQQLDNETISDDVRQCASKLLEVIPPTMRRIRTEMRNQNLSGMSVPQLRALIFISRHNGASLSDLSNHFGVTLPSASKIVDALVEHKLATRPLSSSDRRYIRLALTQKGQDILKKARAVTEEQLAKNLNTLPRKQIAVLNEGLEALRSVFAQESKDVKEQGK